MKLHRTMNLKLKLLCLLLLVSFNDLFSQFSIIQDGANETSYQILNGNIIGINTKAESISFSFSPKAYNNNNKPIWRINSKANAKKGTSNIFKGGEFQFSGQLGANIIFDKTNYSDEEINIIYSFMGANLLYSRNNTFDSLQTFIKQFDAKSNLGFRLDYGWNLQNVAFDNLRFLGTFTSGISISVGTKDNSEIIDQVEVITKIREISTDSLTRVISTTESVLLDNQLKTNQFFSRINLDFGKHILTQRVFLNFHLTYAIDENVSSIFNPAFGIFLMEDGAPLNAVIGFQLQCNDWFNTRNSSKNRWERSSLIFSVGFPFN